MLSLISPKNAQRYKVWSEYFALKIRSLFLWSCWVFLCHFDSSKNFFYPYFFKQLPYLNIRLYTIENLLLGKGIMPGWLTSSCLYLATTITRFSKSQFKKFFEQCTQSLLEIEAKMSESFNARLYSLSLLSLTSKKSSPTFSQNFVLWCICSDLMFLNCRCGKSWKKLRDVTWGDTDGRSKLLVTPKLL